MGECCFRYWNILVNINVEASSLYRLGPYVGDEHIPSVLLRQKNTMFISRHISSLAVTAFYLFAPWGHVSTL
jgi:hypothetical protein